MNIFIMILVILFMGGYFFITSPSQRIMQHETQYAVQHADLRATTECAAARHNATIGGTEFNDACARDMDSRLVCLNAKSAVISCDIEKNKKPEYSFIVTAASQIPDSDYNAMLEILAQYHSDAGAFGIFRDGQIITGTDKRVVPSGLITEMQLTDNQLVYMTPYAIPNQSTIFEGADATDINCAPGTVKTYRFGRWQCIGYNAKTNCAGDMIWDSDLSECVPDESRRPLCADRQTAVIQDDVWECIDPFPDRKCPNNMIARLNYTTMEWECVTNPADTRTAKKCDNVSRGAVYGAVGGTLRIPTSSCTDCEKMITDTETCTSICVPDMEKLSDPKCYPSGTASCSGPGRAIYFGFPSPSYAAQIPAVADAYVPFDSTHSQNRKFNCMDCGNGLIDTELSMPPYTAICK